MAETRFQCPYCGRVGSTSREVAPGSAARCPGCRGTFKIEGTGPEATAFPIAPAQVATPPGQVPDPGPISPTSGAPKVALGRRRIILAVAIGSAILLLGSVAIGLTMLLLLPPRETKPVIHSAEEIEKIEVELGVEPGVVRRP